jgi:hypothetical protein
MDTLVDIKTVTVATPEGKVLNLDDRKTEVAAKIGVNSSSIRTVQMQLETLRKQGVLVDLSISGTSMFTRSTSWVELGIQPDADDKRTERFTRGQKYLIPEEEIKRLRSIETSMRSTLDYFGQSITGFRPYRWIPFTAYEAWRERWQDLTDRFYAVKADILANYDYYVDRLKDDFAAVAVKSWNSIQAQGYDWVILNGKPYGREDFIQAVIDDAMSKLPSRKFIEENLQADYVTALVYGLEDMESDKARAALIKSQADAERIKNDLDVQAKSEQVCHAMKVNQLIEMEKEAKIEAMWKAEIEHAREQLGEIVSPFEEVFRNLRNRFADDAADMLASIQKNGFVRGKVAEKGRGLVELFDMWAVHNDAELRAKLIELKRAIGPNCKERTDDTAERSTEEVKTILQSIAELAHQSAVDLQKGPSRFSFIE